MSFFKNFPRTKYEFGDSSVKTNIVDLFRYIKLSDTVSNDNIETYRYYEIHDGERPDVVSYKLYGTPDYYWTFFIINDHLRNGFQCWPLSTQEFEAYMDIEYEGTIISGKPEVTYDSDGLVLDNKDSIAGRFKIGETVVGSKSQATGKIVEKNSRYNYLVLENVTGTFRENEFITGNTTLDRITSYKVWDRKLGPKYYLNGDGDVADHSDYIKDGHDKNTLTMVTNVEWEIEANDKRSKIRVVRPEHIQDFILRFKDLVEL